MAEYNTIEMTPDELMGTNTPCAGAYCEKSTESIGETEGVDAIIATVKRCERVAGCVLDVSKVEVL